MLNIHGALEAEIQTVGARGAAAICFSESLESHHGREAQAPLPERKRPHGVCQMGPGGRRSRGTGTNSDAQCLGHL